MNVEQWNVTELSSAELMEISGGQGKPVPTISPEQVQELLFRFVKPITDEDVCREFGDC